MYEFPRISDLIVRALRDMRLRLSLGYPTDLTKLQQDERIYLKKKHVPSVS
jgi:hypothetical protein